MSARQIFFGYKVGKCEVLLCGEQRDARLVAERAETLDDTMSDESAQYQKRHRVKILHRAVRCVHGIKDGESIDFGQNW